MNKSDQIIDHEILNNLIFVIFLLSKMIMDLELLPINP